MRLSSAGLLSVFLLPGCDLGPKQPPMEAERIILDDFRAELARPYAKAFGDMDGDGLPDVLVADLDGPIYWYRYPGWEPKVLSADNGGFDLAVADLDRDGRLDVVSGGRDLAWYRNTRRGFEEEIILPGRRGDDLTVGDVDGDGREDIVLRDGQAGRTSLLIQETELRWTEVMLPHEPGARDADLADMDGDGLLDIVIGAGYIRQGDDARSPEAWRRVGIGAAANGWIGKPMDVDRDGNLDLVLAPADREADVAWHRNPGPGPQAAGKAWTRTVVHRTIGPIHGLRGADLDGDGAGDLLFAEGNQGPWSRVGALLNPGGPGRTWGMRLFDRGGSHGLDFADVGGDGEMELLAVNGAGDTRIRLLTHLLKGSRERVRLAAKRLRPTLPPLREPALPVPAMPVATAAGPTPLGD